MDRGRRRRLVTGLRTVLGLSREGFFIPHRHAGEADGWSQRSYRGLEPHFERARPRFEARLAAIEALAGDLRAIGGEPPPAPRFDQSWFPRLDAALLYALVRQERPRAVVEVGSGHSTRFLAAAAKSAGGGTAVTAVDPAPRADIAGLPLTLVRATLQAAGLAPFAGLAAGDLLLVDSSHVLMPGTDVDIIVNHVLPAAPSGLYVAFHDVFLPDPYPPAWPFDSYNEQLAVAALVASGYAVEFASAYIVTRMGDRLARGIISELPLVAGARESLILLRKP